MHQSLSALKFVMCHTNEKEIKGRGWNASYIFNGTVYKIVN